MNNLEVVGALLAALAVLAVLAGLGVVLAIAMAREDGTNARGPKAGEAAEPRIAGSTLLWRALRRRCPRCGTGRVFRSYLRMNPQCPVCGAVFWAEEGEWTGAFILDYSCATAAAIIAWAVIELTAPKMGLLPELGILAGAIVVSGLAVFPFSRSLWTVFLYLSGMMGERSITRQTPPRQSRDR